MKSALLLFKANGKASILHGPDVLHSEQLAALRKFRDEGLPKGIERAEIWTRMEPKRIAVRPPAPEEKPEKELQASKSPEQPNETKAKPANESPSSTAAPAASESSPEPAAAPKPTASVAEFVAKQAAKDELGE